MDFIFDQLPLPKISRTEKKIRGVAKIARAGVQKYYEDGEVFWDYRPESEVERLLDQIHALPVTLNHPYEAVEPSNYRLLNRGGLVDGEYNRGWLEASIVVLDDEAQGAIESGIQEFSIGAWADRQKIEGIWVDDKGIQGPVGKAWPYNRIQKNLTLNHVAIVDTARAGHEATFMIRDSQNPNTPHKVYYSLGLSDNIIEDNLTVPANTLTDEQGNVKDLTINFENGTDPIVSDSSDQPGQASQETAEADSALADRVAKIEDSLSSLSESITKVLTVVSDSQEAKATTQEASATEQEDKEPEVKDSQEEVDPLTAALEKLTSTVATTVADAIKQGQISSRLTQVTDSQLPVEDQDPWSDLRASVNFDQRTKS